MIRVYAVSRLFPVNERFGLTAQLRRAAVSITSNIAEGRSRVGQGPYRALVDVALGSAGEVDYQLLLARDLGYVTTGDHLELETELREIRRMLAGLRRALSANA